MKKSKKPQSQSKLAVALSRVFADEDRISRRLASCRWVQKRPSFQTILEQGVFCARSYRSNFADPVDKWNCSQAGKSRLEPIFGIRDRFPCSTRIPAGVLAIRPTRSASTRLRSPAHPK